MKKVMKSNYEQKQILDELYKGLGVPVTKQEIIGERVPVPIAERMDFSDTCVYL